MRSLNLGGDAGGFFLVIGLVVVLTLVTLPFVGRFFTAALVAGVGVAVLLRLWTTHKRH